MDKKKRTFLQKLRNKYRLELFDESTFSALLSFRVSRLYIMIIASAFSLLFIAIVFLLVVFTPIKTFIPGYPDKNTRLRMERNAILVDSLIQQFEKKERFFEGIVNIIYGEDFKNNRTSSRDSLAPLDTKKIVFSRSATDSLFRRKHENIEKYSLKISGNKTIKDLATILFYAPLKGIISLKFNPQKKHFGVDIISKENARVSSILDGTVIFAGWTLDTGYVLQIQHRNNLVSVYKHNSELLKKQGAHVKSGEVIALLGNSGELTSGPHLHFEIWHNGRALNPEDYIKF